MDFGGTRRSRDTHESSSDPEALLYQKSDKAEAVPAYLGHVLMENRNGLAVDVRLTQTSGTAEREAALEMLAAKAKQRRISVGQTSTTTTRPSWTPAATWA